MLREFLWVDSLNIKSTTCQCSCLIEYYRRELCQSIHIVTTLNEDSLMRSPTDTRKEGKRNRNNQSTWATYNQEGQCTIEPNTKGWCVTIIEERRNNSQSKGGNHHDRRIDTCKTTNERLTA